jgi:non-ribosomal peptide synthetase component F
MRGKRLADRKSAGGRELLGGSALGCSRTGRLHQLNAITRPKISGQLRKSEMTGRLSPVQEIWNVLIFEPNRDGGAHVASETR